VTEAGTDEQRPEPPRHWEADVLLLDGSAAHIRPIRPEDADLLVEFYARVSDESKYFRFFSPMPNLAARDIARFTQVDHVNRVAFVVVLANEMIAVGRFDVTAPGEAEVAFLVQDQHQGRGIAQILLEHLAQAGRELGVGRFVAEVLPQNRRMIQTLQEAGYSVGGGYEDGVMNFEFSIDPTTTAMGVMQSREHRAESASIEKFFNARSVAVIGASRRQDTIGQALVRNLITGDFTGRVYAVNPSADAVSGLPAFKLVSDIPDDVDLAIVAVPASAVQDVVLDCAAKGVKGLVVISSGFAETGDEGRRRQRMLVGLARSYGLRLIGPNCLGVINTDPEISLNASLSGLMPPRGRAGSARRSWRRSTTVAWDSPRSSPQATAPTSPATTSCSTGRRTTPPRSCCSTWSRSATRASSHGSPVASRAASRSWRCAPAAPPRVCPWGTQCAPSPLPERLSTPCSGRPG